MQTSFLEPLIHDMAVSLNTELKIEAEVEQSRVTPASIDLVYLFSEESSSVEIIYELLKADCQQYASAMPASILKKIAEACIELQIGLNTRYSEFLNMPSIHADQETDLFGWLAVAEIKQTNMDTNPYLQLQLTPVGQSQFQSLDDQTFPSALLQRLRIFVHDYNNVSHIAQGYLGYVQEEVDSDSDTASDVQGAIEAIKRNSLLTEELSNLTQKYVDKNNQITQVNSLIYNFLEARKYPLFESFIGNKSRFIAGEKKTLLSALISLTRQFKTGDIEVSTKLESVGDSYENDAILLMPGEYLVIRLVGKESIAQSTDEPNIANEIAWASKIITSLGGEVEKLESDYEEADISQSFGLNIYLPLQGS